MDGRKYIVVSNKIDVLVAAPDNWKIDFLVIWPPRDGTIRAVPRTIDPLKGAETYVEASRTISSSQCGQDIAIAEWLHVAHFFKKEL
jgi:hypothetical protein